MKSIGQEILCLKALETEPEPGWYTCLSTVQNLEPNEPRLECFKA